MNQFQNDWIFFNYDHVFALLWAKVTLLHCQVWQKAESHWNLNPLLWDFVSSVHWINRPEKLRPEGSQLGSCCNGTETQKQLEWASLATDLKLASGIQSGWRHKIGPWLDLTNWGFTSIRHQLIQIYFIQSNLNKVWPGMPSWRTHNPPKAKSLSHFTHSKYVSFGPTNCHT